MASSSNYAGHESPHLLLDLPQEILDMIYHELLLSTTRVKVNCHIEGWSLKSKYDALYGEDIDRYFENYTQEPKTLPRWLLTSKKVFIGGMIQLLSGSRCRTQLKSLTSGRACTSSFAGSLLTGAMKALVVEIETSFWSEDSRVRKPSPVCSAQLSELVPVFSQYFRNLTILALAHSVTASELSTGKEWRRLDYSVLQGLDLPQLHTLESHSEVLGMTADGFRGWSGLRRSAQQEIAMLGMKLIGRHGKLLSNEIGPHPRLAFGYCDQRTLICVWTLKQDRYRSMFVRLSQIHRQMV